MGLSDDVWIIYGATFEPNGALVDVNYYVNGSSFGSETDIGYSWASYATSTHVTLQGFNNFSYGTMLRYPRVLSAGEMTTVYNHLSSYYPIGSPI